MCLCIAASICAHRRRVFGAQLLQVRVEAAVAEQPCERELHEVLRVRVEALLDQRDLLHDRRRRRQPSEPQPGREHLREAVQMDDEVLRVELVQRRRRRLAERQLAIRAVLDDRHPIAFRQLQHFAARADRHRDAGRILERGVRVNQLRAISQQRVLELVDVAVQARPSRSAWRPPPETTGWHRDSRGDR